MYPKSTASSQSGKQKGSQREVLADLLHNKFRNKYHVDLTQESALDSKIKAEIAKMVTNKPSLHEKDLNELDRRIVTVVQNCREAGSKAAQSTRPADDDTKSRASHAPSNASRAKSQA